MRGLAFALSALGIVVAACSSNSPNNNDAGGADAQPDVPNVNGNDAGDGGQDSATDGSTTCDAIAQTGCAQNEKCTWVRDSVNPVTGELRCVPNGNAPNGGNCSFGASGPTTGYDNCMKGMICQAGPTEGAAGVCVPICSTTAAANTPGACPAKSSCSTFSGYFANSGSPTTGLCQYECEPLSETRLTDNAVHCGGTVDGNGQPSLGCYGAPSQTSDPTVFICSKAGPITNTTDVVCQDSNMCSVNGTPVLNGCAPGYWPYKQSTASTTYVCESLCKPADTSTASPQNAAGASPYTCTAMGHECRYWWFNEGATTPTSIYTDGLGFCLDYAKYQYDSNNDGIPDTTFPSCKTLSTTAHNFDTTLSDAAFWGCVAK